MRTWLSDKIHVGYNLCTAAVRTHGKHGHQQQAVVCIPGELFNFDAEVEPLLEVLVGKVLEQALMEVLEEEELAALKQHQQHFEAIR